MDIDNFNKLDKPLEVGYLSANNIFDLYPAVRYRGTENIIVANTAEDKAAADAGFHVAHFSTFDVAREVDYGYDLSRLNPMQLVLYADDIGLNLDPDYSIKDCVLEIQRFMMRQHAYHGRMTLIAQEISFDYRGAQDEILQAVKQAGGVLL